MALSFFGGVFAFATSFIFPNQPLDMIIAMMFLASGAGFCFPICERLGIESSSEPMGSKIAISSLLMGIFGMLGSVLISGFYNDTLWSLAVILLLLCVIAVVLSIGVLRDI